MSYAGRQDVLKNRLKSEIEQIPSVLSAAIFALLTGTGITGVKTECNIGCDGNLDTLLQKMSRPTLITHRQFKNCRDQHDCSTCRGACGLCTLKLHRENHDYAKMVLQVVRCVWSNSIFAGHLMREWLLLRVGPTSDLARLLDKWERKSSDQVLLIQVLNAMKVQETPVQKEIREAYDTKARTDEVNDFNEHVKYQARQHSKGAKRDEYGGEYGCPSSSVFTSEERRQQAVEANEMAAAARDTDRIKVDRRRNKELTAAEAISAYAKAADVSAVDVSAVDVSAVDVSAVDVRAVDVSAAVEAVLPPLDEKSEKWKASKKLLTLKKKAGELRNILRRSLKNFEITSDEDQLKFTVNSSSLYDVMVEIRDCRIPGSETCFNELVKSMEKLIEPVNAILSTAGSEISFNFELFRGPEAVLAAKISEEEEEEKKRQSAKATSHRRLQLGFTFRELSELPQWLNLLILRFLTTPCLDAVEDDVQCQKTGECKRIHDLLCNKQKVHESLVSLRGSYSQKLNSRRMGWDMMCSRNCMMIPNRNCPTCTSFSILCQMTHGLNRDAAENVGYRPNLNLDDGILASAMNQFNIRFHYLFLDTYLSILQPFGDDSVNTLTIPNIRNAITNPESEVRGELIGALTDYEQSYPKGKMESKNEEHNALFKNWKLWYENPISNSAFHPYPFLPRLPL
jgi:hypothetical protein